MLFLGFLLPLPSVPFYCYEYVKFSKMKPPYHMVSALDHYIKSGIAKIELNCVVPNTESEFSTAMLIQCFYTWVIP